MNNQLTAGSISMLSHGQTVDKPILQLLNFKKVSGSNVERYRLILSDGINFISYGMLATQLNPMINNNELTIFSIIRVDQYQVTDLNKRNIVVILSLTIIESGDNVRMKIGNPTSFDTASPSSDNVVNVPGSSVNGPQVPQSSNMQQPSTSNGGASRYVGNSEAPAAMAHSSINNDNNATGDFNVESVGSIIPIVALNPYQNRWVIKARVATKSAIRPWKNGQGTLCNLSLQDESGEIRMTAFTDAVNKFHDMLELNKVYYFSKCQVKPANKQFSNMNHDFELYLNINSFVRQCNEVDSASIPEIQYNFTPLSTLKDMNNGSTVDVIGICQSAGEIQNLVAKTSKRELKKRDIALVDQSDSSITLTLWDKQAEDFDGSSQPVVAIKAARMTEFNGSKSVGIGNNSTMIMNPDITQAHQLRGWFESLGDNHSFNNVSTKAGGVNDGGKMYLLKEINMHQLGTHDRADYFNITAVIMFIQQERALYQACPTPDCKKKVTDQSDGTFRCEKCNQAFPNFIYRLMLSAQVGDWSGSQWITLFQEPAEELLGATSQEIGLTRDNGGDYDSYFRRPLFEPMTFRVRAKMDSYNGENRMRLTVTGVKKLDFKAANKRLLEEIKSLSGVGIQPVN